VSEALVFQTLSEMVLRGVEVVLAEHEPKRKKRTLPVIKSNRPGTIGGSPDKKRTSGAKEGADKEGTPN
jgi:hypothetical protein